MDESEQWLLDGRCSICRRKKYCSKPCKACKNRREFEMRSVFAKAMIYALTRKKV